MSSTITINRNELATLANKTKEFLDSELEFTFELLHGIKRSLVKLNQENLIVQETYNSMFKNYNKSIGELREKYKGDKEGLGLGITRLKEEYEELFNQAENYLKEEVEIEIYSLDKKLIPKEMPAKFTDVFFWLVG